MPDAATLERRAKLLAERVVLGGLTDANGVVTEAFVSVQNPSSVDFIYRRYVDFQDLMQTTPKLVKVKIVGTWEDVNTYDQVTFELNDEAELINIRYNQPLTVLLPRTNERMTVDIIEGVRKYLVLTRLDEWDGIRRW